MIFQTNKDGSLPPHVMYKIRQNSSLTEKTNEIRRAYWRPGPNTGGKFYFLYGFVWIQGKELKFTYFPSAEYLIVWFVSLSGWSENSQSCVVFEQYVDQRFSAQDPRGDTLISVQFHLFL